MYYKTTDRPQTDTAAVEYTKALIRFISIRAVIIIAAVCLFLFNVPMITTPQAVQTLIFVIPLTLITTTLFAPALIKMEFSIFSIVFNVAHLMITFFLLTAITTALNL